MSPPVGAAAEGVREEVTSGALPRLAVRWTGSDLVAGVTTRALNFGRHTREPAHRVAEAYSALGVFAAGRFDAVVGGAQVHGTRLFRADGLAVPEERPRTAPYTLRIPDTDGFLTSTPGVLLTIGIADCVPVFLHAPAAGAVALLHAGWRGVAGGILPVALAALRGAYGVEPVDCLAYWGPAIGPCCYPVGDEVIEAIRVTAAGPGTVGWVDLDGDAPRVDLRAALTRQAEAAGVPLGVVAGSRHCTSCDGALFHSYRRERGEGGRMLAFAGFPGARWTDPRLRP